LGAFTSPYCEYQQHYTDADKAVGDVKRRPVVSVYVNVQEIHHVTLVKTVDDVPDGPADDKGQRGQFENAGAFELEKKIYHRSQGYDGKQRDDFGDYGVARIGKYPPYGPAVFNIAKQKKSLYHMYDLVGIAVENRLNNQFGNLVHDNNETK
jgi:hypothetical protein